jgi:glycosyltransferase involved in cell wall biosynthesis
MRSHRYTRPHVGPQAPIRIVRVITRLNIGGPAIHALLLTHELNDGVEFESTLVAGTTAPHEGNMVDLARSRSVAVQSMPTLGREISPLDDLVSFAQLVRLMRRLRPDVVHTHMAKAGTVGRLAAMVCRVPLIVHTYHGHVFHSYFSPLKTRIFVTIERALGLGTSRIIVLGEGQRDEIAGYGVAPREKLVPIRLGLDLQPFLQAERARGTLRRELGIDATSQLVGIVARLVPIKAHETFFEAASLVRRERPDTHFIVIGDGERRAELEGLVRRLDLQEHVVFVGWRDDMVDVYADLDVVALSSLNEGSPVSLIEALTAARPVVATAVGGVPEVVLDGETGLLVPPSAPRALADGMLWLLQHRAQAERLGVAGRRHVYPRYDSSRLVDDIRTLYRRELPGRGQAVDTIGAAVG